MACLVLLTNVLSKCTRTRNYFVRYFIVFYIYIKISCRPIIYFFNIIIISSLILCIIYFLNVIIILSLIVLVNLRTNFTVKLIMSVKNLYMFFFNFFYSFLKFSHYILECFCQ